MAVGLSIVLLAVGAVLAFATKETTFSGLDVHIVGWILMGAGTIGLIWTLLITWLRRDSVVVAPRRTRVVERDLPEDEVVRHEAP